MIKNFDPAPSRAIQEKVDFFFMPYDLKFSISKSVKFSTKRQKNELLMKLRDNLEDKNLSEED